MFKNNTFKVYLKISTFRCNGTPAENHGCNVEKSQHLKFTSKLQTFRCMINTMLQSQHLKFTSKVQTFIYNGLVHLPKIINTMLKNLDIQSLTQNFKLSDV